ncbi:MAG TPA: zf-HC2 domain-containing protein [Ktedonobacterales bacterium]
MSVETPCRDGITSELLSIWGDGGLPEVEAARLRAHVADCPACQMQLAAYSAVGALVRDQRVPPAPPVDLAAVRAGTRPSRVTAMNGRGRLPRTVWGGLGAAVAAALLITAFSQVFAHLNRVSPTATATPMPHHTTGLTWSQRTFPPGLALTDGNLNIAFSPTDDQAAWICSQASDGSFAIWTTTDQARTWRIAGHFTQRLTTERVSECQMIPDSVSPHVLAISFSWGCGECGTNRTGTYITGDGGATWHALPGDRGLWSLATLGSRTYAIAYDTSAPSPPGPSSVIVSGDGLKTWRATGPATNVTVYFLWPNPATGALLLGGESNQVWLSAIGAPSWTPITFTKNIVMNPGQAVWLPARSAWRVCGRDASPTAANAPPSGGLLCTMDLGKTWTAQPTLNQTVTCVNCKKGGGPLATQTECYPSGMAPDGSMYSRCQPTQTVAQGQQGVTHLFRLAPNATAWEDLGAPPSSIANPFATSASGTPLDGPPPTVGALDFSGNQSGMGRTVWYSDPAQGILEVATLPGV